MFRRLFIVLLPAVLAACTVPVSTQTRPESYYLAASEEPQAASLFSSDQSVLSDEAVGRILEYRYSPPELGRVALMPFGREVWSEWSEELAIASDRMRSRVMARLVESPRVYDASYLPSILIPERKSVPFLREAAARYQADLLLVYRSYCRSFQRNRLFAADRSRAYCGVEAVLLDTRTGLVPFTSVAFESIDVVENDDDINFRETIVRAQLNATETALIAVIDETREFLSESGSTDSS